MRLIKPSHEIWEQDTSGKPLYGIVTSPETIHESLIHGLYQQIERAARVCYKSEDRITEGSAELFVERLINSKHYAMLEHGTVYLAIPCSEYYHVDDFLDSYGSNPYTQYDMSDCYWEKKEGKVYVTTNLRVLVENYWTSDLIYMCMPTEHHPRRVTVHLTTNRQVTHELVRHRKISFAMESTRYCNYSKDKFGGELTFILPNWTNLEEGEYSWMDAEAWEYVKHPDRFALKDLMTCEYTYERLIKSGWTPQQAATVLPNALKAEIVVTGFVNDWYDLFALRVEGVTGTPHPQMLEVMTPVYNEFKEKGYLDETVS